MSNFKCKLLISILTIKEEEIIVDGDLSDKEKRIWAAKEYAGRVNRLLKHCILEWKPYSTKSIVVTDEWGNRYIYNVYITMEPVITCEEEYYKVDGNSNFI